MVDTEWWRLAGYTMSPGTALGRNVVAQRKAAGLDQAALARRLHDLGFSARQNTVSRIENASRPVSADELVALAFVFAQEMRKRQPDVNVSERHVAAGLLQDPESDPARDRESHEQTMRWLRERLSNWQTERDNLEARIAESVATIETLEHDWGVRYGEHQA